MRLPLLAAAALSAFLAARPARAEIKDRIAAVVNGQPILLSEVEDRKGPELARVDALPAAEREAARKDLIHRGLEEMITERLAESEAQSLGYDISEEELQKSLELLAKQNGLENVAQLREAAEKQGVSFDTIRETLRRQQLISRLLQYRVKPRKVSDEEVQAAYAQMSVSSPEEVRARDLFLRIPPGSSPADVAATRKRAEELLKRARSGESFAKLARDYSDGPAAHEGGDLGWFGPGQMREELERAAFALKPGQISDVIPAEGGLHIVKLEERRKVAPKPLSEVQEEIRNRLAGESMAKDRDQYLQSLRKTAQIDQKL